MTSNDLLLEIGSVAYADLTTGEINAIAARYSVADVKLAGMKAFELLSKKFEANYRMGRMYEHLSQKYEHYKVVYKRYLTQLNAGALAHSDDLGEARRIQGDKFLDQTHPTQDVIDAAD